MTSRNAKQRVVHVALTILAIWPAVHLGLVAGYDLSPWKLAGWGMYSTPRFGLLGMEIYGRSAGGGGWQQLTTPSPALRVAATEFLERHRWLRRLASAREVIDTVLAERPGWAEVRIVIAYPTIERSTAMVVLTHDERLHGSSTSQGR